MCARVLIVFCTRTHVHYNLVNPPYPSHCYVARWSRDVFCISDDDEVDTKTLFVQTNGLFAANHSAADMLQQQLTHTHTHTLTGCQAQYCLASFAWSESAIDNVCMVIHISRCGLIRILHDKKFLSTHTHTRARAHRDQT